MKILIIYSLSVLLINAIFIKKIKDTKDAFWRSALLAIAAASAFIVGNSLIHGPDPMSFLAFIILFFVGFVISILMVLTVVAVNESRAKAGKHEET